MEKESSTLTPGQINKKLFWKTITLRVETLQHLEKLSEKLSLSKAEIVKRLVQTAVKHPERIEKNANPKLS